MSRTTGYFKHDHGENPVVLQSAADADVLIDAMLGEQFGNSVAALYADARPPMPAAPDLPDHELRIAIYAEAKVGGIRYAGGDVRGAWYVPGATSEREEVFYLYMGHDEGWPQDSEVSVDRVRQALREFVTGDGARPQSFEWREWPDGLQ